MQQLPKILQLTLRKGNVYKMPYRGLSSPLPHYFIVLNLNPASSEILILAVVTSKIQEVLKRRQNEQAQTLVRISPSDYSELSLDSIIDCNSLLELSLKSFVDNYNSKVVENCDILNEKIVEDVVNGILISRLISPKIKKMLRN